MITLEEIQTEARGAYLKSLEKMNDAEQEAYDFWFTSQFEQYWLVRERQIALAKAAVFALEVERDINRFKDRPDEAEAAPSVGLCDGDMPF